jgi:hypothetical protein
MDDAADLIQQAQALVARLQFFQLLAHFNSI